MTSRSSPSRARPPADQAIRRQLGKKLVALRGSRSRAEQARLLGCSVVLLRQVETGVYPCRLTNFRRRWWRARLPSDRELEELWTLVGADLPAVDHPDASPAGSGTDDVLAAGLGLLAPPDPTVAALYQNLTSEQERYLHAAAAPAPDRIDPQLITYLGEALAAHRRADDVLGPLQLIPVVKAQLAVIDQSCQAATSTQRPVLLRIGAEYAQFLGWLYQDGGAPAAAGYWCDRVAEWSMEAGYGDMIATALSMRASLALDADQPARALSLALAALRDQWQAAPAVQALAAQNVAYAQALLGRREEAWHTLDKVAVLAERAHAHPDRQPSALYWYTPAYAEMQRAVVLTETGRPDQAIPAFQAGLAALPAGARRERGLYLTRLARACHDAGVTQQAIVLAEEAAGIAAATGSRRTSQELRRLAGRLRATGHGQASRGLLALLDPRG
jgi:tetratricopeptide (TPR) repeat protein